MQLSLVAMARRLVLGALVIAWASAPAGAVMSGGKSEQPPPADDAYDQGKAAFEQGDWRAVVAHMARAIEERPWDDDAYNLMGFGYRKLGDYDKALEAYDRALKLNPHHRGALEYLGEAYLELDRPELAKDMLDRLAAECQRITIGAGDRAWQSECEEWQDLSEAYEAYVSDPSPPGARANHSD
jgi:tetratricopeptide (TPR) repeat protein